MFHRLWACPARAMAREQHGISDIIVRKALASPDSLLWTRCQLPDPSQWSLNPCMQLVIHWELQADCGTFSAIGFGDGSGKRNTCSSTRRVGWGVTSLVNTDPSVSVGCWRTTASAYGPLPGLLQTVPAAETFALYIFLLSVGLPLDDGHIYFYLTTATSSTPSLAASITPLVLTTPWLTSGGLSSRKLTTLAWVLL